MNRSLVVTSPSPRHGRLAGGRTALNLRAASASLLLAFISIPTVAPTQSPSTDESPSTDQSPDAGPPVRPIQTNNASDNNDEANNASENNASENNASENNASENNASENDASENDASENDASENDASENDAPANDGEANEDEARGTIDLDGVTSLAEALEAIGVDSGVTFRHRADPATTIEVDGSPLTFWQALDAVLDQASLDVDPFSGDGQVLRLTPRDPERPSRVASAVYLGQYRIEPRTVTARRELTRPRLSGLQVGMQLAWEPELAPIGLSVPIASVSGELDDGTPLVPQDAAGTIDVATNRSTFSSEFFLPLQLPESGSRQIRRLQGKIESMIPGERGRFELALGDPVAEQTIGDMTVRIEAVRRQGELVEVRVGVELENAGRSLESYRQWIFENRATVRLADGSDARHLGMEVYRQTVSGVGVGYLYDLGDSFDRLQLVYESPTSVTREESKFVLRDIPLP